MLGKNNLRIMPLFFIALAASILSCPELKAETDDTQAACSFDSYLRYMPSRKADAMSGEVTVIEASGEYSYGFKMFEKLPVKFSLGNRYIGIENTTNVELPARLVGLATDIETTFPFFKINNIYLRFGISPSFFSDSWDFPASSFRIPLRSYVIYQPNERWTFLAGIAVYPDFEKEVLPILGLIYKPNDRLSFNLTPKRPNISYLLNDRVTLFLGGGSSVNNEFEVAKDNLKGVVLRYKETRLGAGLKYKFNNSVQGSLALGSAFGRYLKYRDSLGKVNIKDSVYGEMRLEINM